MLVYQHILAKQPPYNPAAITKAELQDGDEVVLVSAGKPEIVARAVVVMPHGGRRSTTTYVWLKSPAGKIMMNRNRVEVVLKQIVNAGAALQFMDKTGQAQKKKIGDVGVDTNVLWQVSCIKRPHDQTTEPPFEPPTIETIQDEQAADSADCCWNEGEDAQKLDQAIASANRNNETISFVPPAADEEDEAVDEGGEEIDVGASSASACHYYEEEDLVGDEDDGGMMRSDGDSEAEAAAAGCCGGGGRCHGPHIKLDLLHAQKRIMSTFCTSHGAAKVAGARLRDLFSTPDQHDIAAIQRVIMRDRGMTHDEQWKQYLKSNWRSVLKYCKRVVPPPVVLVERMERFEKIYPGVRDATTGKPLFKEETWKRW